MPIDENLRNKQQEPLRILVFAASARAGSLNAKLAQFAAEVIVKRGAVADFRSIAEFDCPSFNQEVEKGTGIPRVYPDMFSLAMAHQAFTSDNQISNEVLAKRFEATLDGFTSLVEAAKHYPCMKKAWVEFLGERPDPITDRVE